jgi:hypothetical protein
MKLGDARGPGEHRERGGHWVAAVLSLLILLLPGAARADNLGGLVFLIFIWPIGILCFLLMLVLGIIGLVKLRARRVASRFASALLIISIPIAVGYPIFSVALVGAFRAGAPSEVLLVSLLPVELLAAGCVALGLALRARSRQGGAREPETRRG